MKRIITFIIVIVLILSISGCGLISHYVGNKIDYAHNKIDEETKYELLKEVEDTCRIMIASYESDKLTWQQYNGSSSTEQQSWADQAKMRANKTAMTYNNYILKNSYVWANNVPDDIWMELEIIE